MSFISLKDDRGAGLVEYALVVMLISVVGLTAVGFVGERTSDSFEAVGSSLNADSELEADLSPEEKWEKAQADYDDAISDAKTKKADDIKKAKAEYQAALAANKGLPKKERKAANAEAKASQKSANKAANQDYSASVNSAKAARNAAKAEYNADK